MDKNADFVDYWSAEQITKILGGRQVTESGELHGVLKIFPEIFLPVFELIFKYSSWSRIVENKVVLLLEKFRDE